MSHCSISIKQPPGATRNMFYGHAALIQKSALFNASQCTLEGGDVLVCSDKAVRLTDCTLCLHGHGECEVVSITRMHAHAWL